MMILCSAIQHHMTAIMGLDLQPLTLAMQKTQIGYNFLRVLQGIPLKYLQVGGEPVFEKIRVVASTLLELVEEADNESIKARARLCVERLLDVLAQLDSRARDELHSSGGQVILPA
ncbi:hypothetical protein VTK73DRAFT_751 [Phialemonium thermophilum]|uniref:Uncharacterized protein n=1 Tax=Phialemonium thermophilum TaxID=223376 RepID=A0ABR3VUC2_9PEZI